MNALRDVALVARFELLRARRTWAVLAVVLLFAIAAGGSAYAFAQILLEIENGIAENLGVPPVERPGAMTEAVLASRDLHRVLRGLIGDPAIVDNVLKWPLIAVFHFWTSLVTVPFLAAFVCADTVADDVRTKALRFELLRTGRLELVLGRFLGQTALVGFAIGLGSLSAFAVASFYTVITDPLWVLFGLIVMSARAFAWSLPFVGVGLLCSSLSRSAVWARVLALLATVGSFVAVGLVRWAEWKGYALWVSPLSAALPGMWVRSLWNGGGEAWAAALYLAALAITLVGLGHAVLARRDA